MNTVPRRYGDSLRRLADSKKEIRAGPVDIFKVKMTPSVTRARPTAPTISQRFREIPGIIRKSRYWKKRLLVNALIVRIITPRR